MSCAYRIPRNPFAISGPEPARVPAPARAPARDRRDDPVVLKAMRAIVESFQEALDMRCRAHRRRFISDE
jgi:hypothetical protein